MRPTEVRIVNKTPNSSFKIGQKSIVECQVFGSKPSAQVRWFLGSQELVMFANDNHNGNNHYHKANTNKLQHPSQPNETIENNYFSESSRDINNLTKISYLTMIPQISDNQQILTCSAQNPRIQTTQPLSDSITMNVQCVCLSWIAADYLTVPS